MKTAIFKYKCRLCGEEYEDSYTSEDIAQEVLIDLVYKYPMPKGLIGVSPTLLGTHSGCKVGYGVSDLIGYITV